jgi:hypothetical protein
MVAFAHRSPLDVAAFNFFQISQSRFDVRTRRPESAAVEMDLMFDDQTSVVMNSLVANVYRAECGDIDDDDYT